MTRPAPRRSPVTVQDVCAAMDDLAPPGLAYPEDRIGLRIGRPDAPVTRILVALTVTPPAFRAALRARAEMIVSHHPLVWEPLDVIRTDDPTTGLYLDIASAGVACYAAHTNLDVVGGGVNDVLARKLGLAGTRPLLDAPHATSVKLVTFVPESHLDRVRAAVCEAGAGRIGEYTHCTFSAPGFGTFLPGDQAQPFSGERDQVNEEPERRFEVLVPQARLDRVVEVLLEAHPYEEVAYDVVPLGNPSTDVGLGRIGLLKKPVSLRVLAERVRRALGVAHLRYVGDPRRSVQAIGVLGGSGGGEVARIPRRVDALVTGDVGYHDALRAQEQGLALIDAGHAATERLVIPLLARHLRRRLGGVRVSTYREPDPFRMTVG